jgi:O-antigen/teichoic acid export membrane protein
MGVIAKQSVKGSIYNYAGAFVGFINTGLLMPKLFTTDQVGLTQILISFTLLVSQFSNLGFAGVFTRLFPYFRTPDGRHNGILSLGFWVSFVGFVLAMIWFYSSQNYLIESNWEKSKLLAENINYLIPLIFFSIFFLLLDSFNSALFDAALGVFLRDFLTKILNLISIILFAFRLIDFDVFLLLYVLSFISSTIILAVVLLMRKQFIFGHINKSFIKEKRNELISISFFGIFSGFSGIALSTVDNILVNHFLGLNLAGIYVTAFFFGTLVLLPSKVLRKISGIVLANAWKDNDLPTIKRVYEKSTVTQFALGSLLLIGLWINTDALFEMIPDYAPGRYVILFIGLANLVEMFSGVSSMVILSSKHYRMFSLQMLFTLFLLVGLNIILIPILGMNGAGITALVSTTTFAFVRFTFIYRKYQIQPYSLKHFKIFLIAVFVLAINYLIPKIDFYILDSLVRSAIATVVYSFLIYRTAVAEDFNKIFALLLLKVRHFIKK